MSREVFDIFVIHPCDARDAVKLLTRKQTEIAIEAFIKKAGFNKCVRIRDFNEIPDIAGNHNDTIQKAKINDEIKAADLIAVVVNESIGNPKHCYFQYEVKLVKRLREQGKLEFICFASDKDSKGKRFIKTKLIDTERDFLREYSEDQFDFIITAISDIGSYAVDILKEKEKERRRVRKKIEKDRRSLEEERRGASNKNLLRARKEYLMRNASLQ